MGDEAALLAVIASNPGVLAPRKMLSDLYRERGDADRADAWALVPVTGGYFASLIGKRVLSVWLNEQRSTLHIETGDKWHEYHADGDCCSWSWWYRVKGLTALVGHTVHAEADGGCDDVDPKDGLCQQEEDQVYGVTLLTEAGACELCYRNSSNGYYGGFLTPRQHDRRPEDLGVRLLTDWTHPPAERPPQFGCSRTAGEAGEAGEACNCSTCLFPVKS